MIIKIKIDGGNKENIYLVDYDEKYYNDIIKIDPKANMTKIQKLLERHKNNYYNEFKLIILDEENINSIPIDIIASTWENNEEKLYTKDKVFFIRTLEIDYKY